MRDLILTPEFWIAMLCAILIKLRNSPRLTFWGAVFTIISAVTAAMIFTVPLLDYLGLKGEIYAAAVAALVALSAEHFARNILDTTLKDLITLWRKK